MLCEATSLALVASRFCNLHPSESLKPDQASLFSSNMKSQGKKVAEIEKLWRAERHAIPSPTLTNDILDVKHKSYVTPPSH